MTAFTFSAEQLQHAPPEVRRWFAAEIARALGTVEAMPGEARRPAVGPAAATALATCTAQEALQVFELVGRDAVVTRLLFELARGGAVAAGLPGLHALRLADLLHGAGLPDEDHLLAALGLIDRAFRQVRGDDGGSLFGFDDAGHLYLHEGTQLAIRRVWQELVAARAAEQQPVHNPVARGDGFAAPRVGPSEDIATHAPHQL